MDPLFPALPENFAELSVDELAAFIEENGEAIDAVGSDPGSYITKELPSADLLAQMTAAVEAQEAAKAEFASRKKTEETDEDDEQEAVEDEQDEEFAAEVAELAARARAETAAVETEPEPEPEAEQVAEVEEPEPVVAAAPAPAAKPLPRPARSTSSTPEPTAGREISLTAAAGGLGADIGEPIDMHEIAKMMIKRRDQFGHSIPEGSSEKYPIARATWGDAYPPERHLGQDPIENMELIAAATDETAMKLELRRRREGKSLTASGGLCAPTTPYYGLLDISTAQRPVRNSLPSFAATRGGIRYASPIATLDSIGTAMSVITADADAAGGTFATKTCQRIDCPPFIETTVDTVASCLEVGNLLSRTFPELVEQWTSLTLSALARLTESKILTAIDGMSTEVTAGDLGLGASAALFGQYLAAANGYRNRYRTAPDAPLRLLLPFWAVDLIISDVIRSQFERWDTDAAKVAALFRQFNIEPAFYLDGAAGRGQVFGSQSTGDLLPFPSTVVGYLFAEGTFLFLDGGTLDLGLVRDSVLNQTNDYQLFSEEWINVAGPFGPGSLTVVSSVCDSGTVSLPASVTCPVDYGAGS